MGKKAELQTLLNDAQEFAWLAGKLILKYFQTDLSSSLKKDETVVTEADYESEKLLRRLIEKKYPGHGILGEEGGETLPNSPFRWILDPIDGTSSFARGIPLYGVHVALTYENEPILGVINLPVFNEIVAAGQGLGCTLNGRRCSVSQRGDLSKAMVFADVNYEDRFLYPEAYHLIEKVKSHRNWGNCFNYVQVATGRAEIVVGTEMCLWDNGPMITIFEEAGGKFTSWKGERTLFEKNVFGANALLYPEVLKILQKREALLC